MKWLGYALTLFVGFVLGFIATVIFDQATRDGITLREDVTIYGGQHGAEPIA